MNRVAVAVDFDGCLCENAWPEIGAPHWDVIEAAKDRQMQGAELILWTCREDELLKQAVDAAASWGLQFDAINDNLPSWQSAWGNNPRKVGATEYWDDRAVCTPCSYDIADAVSKAIPMKVEEIHVDEYHCPVCGAENGADQGIIMDRYCPNCGQRLEVPE